MQKHNIKHIVKKVEENQDQVNKHNTYLNILAGSNFILWFIIILNYFLNWEALASYIFKIILKSIVNKLN
jgi:hypothetical protein